MEKPIQLARFEFTERLAQLVNECGLPAFVIRQALANLDAVLADIEQKQLENAIAEWNQQKEDTDG